MTIQIELSQLIEKVQEIGAGILTLFDIINLNKQTRNEEVSTFFMLMEVYGKDTNIPKKPEVGDQSHLLNKQVPDNLKILRMKSLDQLTQVTSSIGRTI